MGKAMTRVTLGTPADAIQSTAIDEGTPVTLMRCSTPWTASGSKRHPAMPVTVDHG